MTSSLLTLSASEGDAAIVREILASAGIDSRPASADEIVEGLLRCSLAGAILFDDALDQFDWPRLLRALDAQPPWSDCPLLLLADPEAGLDAGSRLVKALGNVFLLPRPPHPDLLVSVAQAVLRARAAQRRAAGHLDAREAAEARIAELEREMDARVAERMAELAAAEERLRESEALCRQTLELSAQIPWTADAQGRLLTFGPAGWCPFDAEVRRRLSDGHWSDLFHPEDMEVVAVGWRDAVANGTRYDGEHRLLVREGEHRWHRLRAAAQRDAAGRVIRWYGTLEDVQAAHEAAARLQQMQAELIHVSRVSAMGAMASTLAHELNQPLTAITNFVRGCRRLLADLSGEPLDRVRASLEEADASAVRAGEIVRRLRELVARGRVNRCAESLPRVVDEACRTALIDAGSLGVAYRLELDPEAETVVVDRIQVQQVLINLLRNAVDALRGASVREILIRTRVRSADFCEVAVHDSGPGVPPELLDRLFTPFTTSKAGGLGIGLSISRTIVETHGGQISARSGEDGGSVFSFTLPRH